MLPVENKNHFTPVRVAKVENAYLIQPRSLTPGGKKDRLPVGGVCLFEIGGDSHGTDRRRHICILRGL